jgi:hypothetical protein
MGRFSAGLGAKFVMATLGMHVQTVPFFRAIETMAS